jgi:putative transposase
VLRLPDPKPTWGYHRIHDELASFGYQIGASAPVALACRAFSAENFPDFRIRPHAIVACDLFNLDTITLRWPYLFFVIEHASRRVHIFSVTGHSTGAWLTQQAHNMLPAPTAPAVASGS